MSERNIEIVRSAIAATDAGDVAAATKDAAPDFEFDFSRAIGPQGGMYGVDQLQKLWHDFTEPWQSVHFEADQLVDAGDDVAVAVTTYHRGRDGIEVETHAAWVWTIRDGKVTRIQFFQEWREALESIERPDDRG